MGTAKETDSSGRSIQSVALGVCLQPSLTPAIHL